MRFAHFVTRSAQLVTFRGRHPRRRPTMRRMKKILILLFLLTFAVNAWAGGDGCTAKGPRTAMDDAMDEIHASLSGDKNPEQVVAKWLSPVALELEKPGAPSATALHAAVDLGRQLVQLGRRDEARALFDRIANIDREGEWGRKASGHIRSMGAGK